MFLTIPRNPRYRGLLAAATISQLGDWSARLALAALLFEATGDAVWVGAVSAAFIAPWILVGQLLTAWCERFSRLRVLIVGDTARAAIFLGLAAVELPPGLTLVVIVMAATVDPVFEANASATIYDALPIRDRDEGIRAKQVLNLLAQVAGVGAAGVALRWFSPQEILVVNAVSFLVSATIIASTRDRGAERTEPSDRSDILRGLRTAASQPYIRAALGTTMVTAFSATAVEAQVVVLASGHPSWVLPIASALIPLGAAVGAAAAPTLGPGRSLLLRSLALTTTTAVVAAVLLESTSSWSVVAVCGLAGLMFQTTTTGQVVAFRHLPVEGRASVINMLQTLVFVAISAGGLVSGVAISTAGLETGLQLCLGATLLAWMVPIPPAYEPQHAL